MALLFALALIIRVWGITWSLPYVGHVDEPKIVDSGVRMIKTGNLNPQLFIWPSFWIYVQALIYKANLIWGMWRGYYVGPASLPDSNHVFALAPQLYLWGRAASGIVGAAAVAVLFALGRRVFNWRVGLAAALLLASSPLHIEYSHYLVTDVAVGFCGLLALVASWRLARHPGWRITLLCGALVGLAAGTKYNGVYIGLVPATALLIACFSYPESFWKRLRRFIGWGVLLLLPLAAVFLITNPFVLLDWTDWSRGFVFQINAYLPADNISQMIGAVKEHLGDLWDTDRFILLPGALGAALVLIEGIWRGRRGAGDRAQEPGTRLAVDDESLASVVVNPNSVSRLPVPGSRLPTITLAALLLIPFPIIYTLLMSRFKLVYERNLILTLPFLCLLGGYLLDRVAAFVVGLIRSREPGAGSRETPGSLNTTGANDSPTGNRQPTTDNRQPRSRLPAPGSYYALAIILAVVVAAEPTREMVNFDRYMAQPETRNITADWIMGALRDGKRLAVELHPLAFCAEAPHTCPAPDVYAPNNTLTNHPPEWYAQRGYDYVVLSGTDYLNIGDPTKDGQRDPKEWTLYKDLPGPDDGPRLFPGDKLGGKGPDVLVLKVGNGISDLPVTHKIQATFGDMVELYGYDLAPIASPDHQFDPVTEQAQGDFTRGAALGLNLYWQALKEGSAISGSWAVAVHLVGPDGSTVAQIDVPPISHNRQRPAQEWYKNEFMPGAYNLPLAANLQPGEYIVRVSFYNSPNGPSLRAQLPDGTQSDYLDLQTIQIK